MRRSDQQFLQGFELLSGLEPGKFAGLCCGFDLLEQAIHFSIGLIEGGLLLFHVSGQFLHVSFPKCPLFSAYGIYNSARGILSL